MFDNVRFERKTFIWNIYFVEKSFEFLQFSAPRVGIVLNFYKYWVKSTLFVAWDFYNFCSKF